MFDTEAVRKLSNHPVHLIDDEGGVGDEVRFKREHKIQSYHLEICRSSRVGLKPIFLTKTQPIRFNWFKPVLMGLMGRTGENSESLRRFRIKEPNLENQKIFLNKMDN